MTKGRLAGPILESCLVTQKTPIILEPLPETPSSQGSPIRAVCPLLCPTQSYFSEASSSSAECQALAADPEWLGFETKVSWARGSREISIVRSHHRSQCITPLG